ncbi:hypothetical protein GQ54DRAFT_259678 [Martensiomyces pterosporus]|nr:hypothetical protein GQ54DRAFT_259678 [Martensiomyces pterosporus]
MQLQAIISFLVIATASVSAVPRKHRTTSTKEHSPEATSSNPASGSFSGDGTFFSPNTGACGKKNTKKDLIAALNKPQYGNVDSVSKNCFKCALVKGPLGEVKVQITDACPECKFGSLDLSPAAFNKIAKPDDGRVKITWHWVNC